MLPRSFMLAALVFVAGCATTRHDDGLKVGDPAPELAIGEWIQGDAVSLAEGAGRIHVIEFWATWCPPCRRSIPHLSTLQRHYGEDIVIVGVSDERAAKLHDFLGRMGDDMIYTVARDTEGETFRRFMKAAGETCIPHAFVIDRDGRIAWHGHPAGELEDVLARLLGTPAPRVEAHHTEPPADPADLPAGR